MWLRPQWSLSDYRDYPPVFLEPGGPGVTRNRPHQNQAVSGRLVLAFSNDDSPGPTLASFVQNLAQERKVKEVKIKMMTKTKSMFFG